VRGKKERKGTGEGKGHEKRKSPKTLIGTVRVALPVWLCHPPHCSHLHLTLISHFTPHTSHLTLHTSHYTPHTSHLTLHTSHCTLHTTTTVPPPPPPPPPPTQRGPPAAQGQVPLIPGRRPCPQRTSAAFGGGAPCCSQGPALAEREPPSLPGAQRP
jgi:hypothetical protein